MSLESARTRQRMLLAGRPRYLALYNVASAAAWTTVLGRTALAASLGGPAAVHASVGTWTRWTQTAAVLEVLHSLLRIVRAPLLTTLVQVASRLLLVWGVVYPLPHLAASPFYTSMLLAWSVTEVIRYSYFSVLALRGGGDGVPDALTWLRYSTFTVLYPVGITSEVRLVLGAYAPSRRVHPLAPWVLAAALVLYVPCSVMLYTHMLAQRRKVLSRLAAGAAGEGREGEKNMLAQRRKGLSRLGGRAAGEKKKKAQ